jgi:hypothetical protein
MHLFTAPQCLRHRVENHGNNLVRLPISQAGLGSNSVYQILANKLHLTR